MTLSHGARGMQEGAPEARALARGGATAQRLRTATAGAVVLAVDQASKAFALSHLAPAQSVPVLGSFLTLRLERNTGAAFGLFGGGTVWLAALAVGICAVLWYLSGRTRQPGVAWSLGLVLGGALGNLVDRIVRHAVVDFIDVRLFSVFNAADTAITLGALWLVWQMAHAPEGTERP